MKNLFNYCKQELAGLPGFIFTSSNQETFESLTLEIKQGSLTRIVHQLVLIDNCMEYLTEDKATGVFTSELITNKDQLNHIFKGLARV